VAKLLDNPKYCLSKKTQIPAHL